MIQLHSRRGRPADRPLVAMIRMIRIIRSVVILFLIEMDASIGKFASIRSLLRAVGQCDWPDCVAPTRSCSFLEHPCFPESTSPLIKVNTDRFGPFVLDGL